MRSSVKTFHDLEVYKNTTQLAVEIFQIKIPKQSKSIEKKIDILKDIAKLIPKFIAESNGDKFLNLDVALNKLEHAMQLISNVITKIDFLIASIEKTRDQRGFE